MRRYVFSFFFPTQVGGRQELTVDAEAANAGTAFARAWRQVKRNPKLKGRRGIDTSFKVSCQAFDLMPPVDKYVGTHDPEGPA